MNEQHLESAYQPRDKSKERHEYLLLIPATLDELKKWGHNVDNLNPTVTHGLYLTERDVSRGLKRWLEDGCPDPQGETGLQVVKNLVVKLLIAQSDRDSLKKHNQEIQTLFDAAIETRNEALETIQAQDELIEKQIDTISEYNSRYGAYNPQKARKKVKWWQKALVKVSGI